MKTKVYIMFIDYHNSGPHIELHGSEQSLRDHKRALLQGELESMSHDCVRNGPEAAAIKLALASGDVDAAWKLFAYGDESFTHPRHPDDYFNDSMQEIEVVP